MTREIAHAQMFEAALATIKPNFPPGVLQGDPSYSNLYFNMSNGTEVRAPWNEGASSKLGETWQYISNPIGHIIETNGLVDQKIAGTDRTQASVEEKSKELGKMRSTKIREAIPKGENSWCSYPQNKL